MTYHRNDYVRLSLDFPVNHDIYVVAADDPSLYGHHETECWIIAVHDNDWDQVGAHVSTCFVKRHNPVILYRDPENL